MLDADCAPEWAARTDLEASTLAELAREPEVIAAVGRGRRRQRDARTGRAGQALHDPAGRLVPGGEELTPTMKLKRKPIEAKYESQIEAMYQR